MQSTPAEHQPRDGWQDVLKGMRCPACGSTRLGHHSSYRKYLYEQPITILRLRCRGCGRTHAVIPSWSLPDTSVGTAEVERYLMARERGVSRSVALEEPRRRGMHAGYGKQLERRLGVIVSRGKSLCRRRLTGNSAAWRGSAPFAHRDRPPPRC